MPDSRSTLSQESPAREDLRGEELRILSEELGVSPGEIRTAVRMTGCRDLEVLRHFLGKS